ncbi:MAG: alpha-1,2-fucosyltransferase, partial [Lachnospiraceae bacterium]|nr:alpha-1,2-fucosyltransferase [Lachnospiraceae bacterium]
NSVSVHVRRGDFVRLGTDLPESYYKKAMDYFRANTEDPVFYCFSDDIEYCKRLFGDTVKYVEGNDALRDFWTMSLCRHNITANSTFSAWAAWINKNDDKVVIHPANWHGKESTEVDERIWPEKWVCL